MHWSEVFTIIGVLGGLMFYLFNRVDQDIKGVSDRLDKWIMHSTARMDSQSKRTDQLYESFLQSQREMQERFKQVDQKFYDLLKERK